MRWEQTVGLVRWRRFCPKKADSFVRWRRFSPWRRFGTWDETSDWDRGKPRLKSVGKNPAERLTLEINVSVVYQFSSELHCPLGARS